MLSNNAASMLQRINPHQVPYLLLVLGALLAGALVAPYLAAESRPFRNRWVVPSALAVVCLIGGMLRFWHLDFGLPIAFHPDEHQKAVLLSRMIEKGTIDPGLNLHPPLLLYLAGAFSHLIAALPFEAGTTGWARLLLGGRAASALLGTLSIPLVYCIAARLFDKRAALLSALLIAVSPIHITNSRYRKEDVLFIFFALLCIVAVLKAVQENKPRFLFAAGFLAGLSAGSKYSGLVCILVLLAAPWLRAQKFSFIPERRFLYYTLAAALLFPVGFLAGVPHVITSDGALSQVVGGFMAESRHAMQGHLGLKIDPWSQLWTYHFSRSVIPGMQFLPVLLGLLGMGWLLRRWESGGLFLAGLVLLFYLPPEFARSKPPPQPDRYILPCIPFLCIAASAFATACLDRLSTRRLAWIAGCLIIAFFPLRQSLLHAAEISPDTRQTMREWMIANIPHGKKVLVVGGAVYLPPLPARFQAAELRRAVGREKKQIVQRLKASGYDYLLVSDIAPQRFRLENRRPSRKQRAFQEIKEGLHLVHRAETKQGPHGFHNPVLSLYSLKD